MAADDRLVDLLLQWEELREQGRPVSAEELCRDCPELLDEVRRRLRFLDAVRPEGEPETCDATGSSCQCKRRHQWLMISALTGSRFSCLHSAVFLSDTGAASSGRQPNGRW